MHRTTIIFDEQIERRLKSRASRSRKTVTELLHDFVRDGLNRQEKSVKAANISLASFSMGKPLVDPSDRSRLWDILDEK